MNRPIEVVGRVATVLRTLSGHEPHGSTTTQVATRTGLPRPTVHRLLTSLEHEGLAERDTATGAWRLGPEVHLLGRTAATRYDVTFIAQPYVQKLARLTGESAFFSARRGDETVCLLREDGSFPIRSHVLTEGIRFPLGVASAGLAILAHLSPGAAEEFLGRASLQTDFGEAHSNENIRARIADARQRGWALNAGHIVEGSWGIGAAVFDSQDQPRWALSLTGIETRFTGSRQTDYGQLLLDAAHQLTKAMKKRGE